jgi:FlaA1/EpsC-like NDP-sugar epimerase
MTKKGLILFLVDIVIIIADSFLAAFIRFGKNIGVIYLQEHLLVFLLSGIAFMVAFYIADLYDFKKDFRSPKRIGEIILSSILAFIISGFLIYGRQLVMPGRGIFFLYAGMVIFGVVLCRYGYTYLARHPSFKIMTVVVSTGAVQKGFVSEV